MAEIRQTLSIIKVRFKETAFVIFLSGFAYSIVILRGFFIVESPIIYLFLLAIFLGLGVFLSMYFWGLLRSIHLCPDEKSTTFQLIRIGKHFFWRMMGYSFLTSGVTWLLCLITLVITSRVIPLQISHSLCLLILIKPIVLIPAIIIVYDSKLIESFRHLTRYKLLEAKELIILFLLMLGINCLWVPLEDIPPHLQNAFLFSSVFLVAVGVFFFLAIIITAIRFIVSRDKEIEIAQAQKHCDTL